MWAGQGIGMIHDVPGAGEIVQTLVEEVQSVSCTFTQAPGIISSTENVKAV